MMKRVECLISHTIVPSIQSEDSARKQYRVWWVICTRKRRWRRQQQERRDAGDRNKRNLLVLRPHKWKECSVPTPENQIEELASDNWEGRIRYTIIRSELQSTMISCVTSKEINLLLRTGNVDTQYHHHIRNHTNIQFTLTLIHC